MLSDAMINDLAKGLATGIPVAIAIGLAVAYRMYKADREYKSLSNKIGKDGYTELMCRSWAGDIKGVRELIKSGADINAQDQEGMTALMYACIRADSKGLLEELLVAGADPNLRGVKGGRAIDLAYNRKHSKQVGILEKYVAEE